MRSSDHGGQSSGISVQSPWRHRLKRSSVLLFATSAVCLGWAGHADAVTRTWNFAGSANWSVAGDWNPIGVPAAGDVVNILNSDAISRTITYDYTGAAITLGNLAIGNNGLGSSDTLAMTGSGLALTAGIEEVGESGTGVLTQSVGNNTATGGLNVGFSSNDHGTYNLSGTGTLNTSGANAGEAIGTLGTGSFVQTGGANTLGNSALLDVGDFANSSGTYTLQSGALSSSGGELIGFSGTGVFTQTGGTNTSTNSLNLGYESGSKGTYTLSGGTLSVTNLWAGGDSAGNAGGQGVMTVSGTGMLSCTGLTGISIYNTSGTSVNLQSGGTINTPALALSGTPSLFNWTGGTLHITNNLTFDSAAAPNSTSDAFGSALALNGGQTLSVTGNETIGGVGPFSLTFGNGASTTATGQLTVAPTGTLTLTGGTINQNVTNNGNFTARNGTFTGMLTNQSTAAFTGNFTLGNGLTNNGTVLSIASGLTVTLGGSGLDNNGSMTLAGGTLNAPNGATNSANISGFGTISSGALDNASVITQTGGNLTIFSSPTNFTNEGVINMAAGYQFQLTGGNMINSGAINLNNGNLTGNFQITNAGSGLIFGPGTISVNLANSGTILVPNGITTVSGSSFANHGVIEMSGTAADLTGGATIANDATIEGFGVINANVLNNATIQPTNGTLIFGSILSNPASGLISVVTGSKVLVTEGLNTTGLGANTGIISLAGGTFDNGGQALDNTGQISGFGILNTGQLTNDGAMILTGGSTIVDGPVINSTGQTIVAKNTPVIFTGPVTNNGTIKATSNTVTFAGSYSGNAYISDPATNIFQSNVTITPGGSMSGGTGDQYIMNGGKFTNQGTYNNTGLLQSSDPTTNSATFVQGGTQTWSAGTTFTNTAGTATFLTDAGSASAFNLSVKATGGKVILTNDQHWSGLSLSGAGTLDINNYRVFINYGTGPDPIASIAASIASGYAGGTWTGTGIMSTAAQSNSGSYGIGYADAADPNNPAGLPSGEIEIVYTLLGDANLDGAVNGTDFAILASNFNKAVTGWDQGDFNYDGAANGTDFAFLAANFNKGASQSANVAALDSFAAANGLMADVPEPASAGILLLAGTGMLGRRKRSAHV